MALCHLALCHFIHLINRIDLQRYERFPDDKIAVRPSYASSGLFSHTFQVKYTHNRVNICSLVTTKLKINVILPFFLRRVA